MDKSTKIFKNKSLADVFETIYSNSNSKRKIINELVKKLTEKTSDPNEFMSTMSLIRDYIESSTKNDDVMVKLAAIMERHIKNSNEVNTTDDLNTGITQDEIDEIKKRIGA